MKKLITSVLFLVLFTSIFTNCKKDEGDPPVLPPQESMTIDFSNFTIDAKGAYTGLEAKGVNNSNWAFAALAAGFWKLVIATNLAVPVMTFKQSIDQDPVYLDNKTWQWSYTTTLGSIEYKARLTGKIRTSDVLWKMYITKSGDAGFNDFLWFEGTSMLDGSSGQWILNESYSVPEPILQIDWSKDGASVGTIRYTYVKQDVYDGSYIEYGMTTGQYDSFYTIHYYNNNLAKFSDVNVKWNKSSHNGTVQSIDFMGDNLWHCWDTNKVNLATCP